MKAIWMGVVSLGLLLFSVPDSFAHHSFAAEFDQSKTITLTGTVTKVLFENPHTYVYVDVKGGDGKTENWAFEGGSTSVLYRQGWRKDSLKLQDTVTITGYPAKNGSNLASVKKLVLPDGRQVFVGKPGETEPESSGAGGSGDTKK